MATGVPTYSNVLDTDLTLGQSTGIVSGVTKLGEQNAGQGTILGIAKNLINTIIVLENVVGIVNSAVTTSHDYRIRRRPWNLWNANEGLPAATLYGVWGTVNSIPYLAFNDAVIWTSTFIGMCPWGAVLTGGVMVRLNWASATATAGDVVWGVALEKTGSTTVATDSFDTQTTGTSTTNVSAVELWTQTAITQVNLDGIVAGDVFRLQVQRVATAGGDTMIGDAQLFTVSVESAT